MTSDRPRRILKLRRPWSPTVSQPTSTKVIKEEATSEKETTDNSADDDDVGDGEDNVSDVDYSDNSNDSTLSIPECALHKRRSFSTKEKLAIVAEVENGCRNANICRKHGISASTLSTFVKQKDTYATVSRESLSKAEKLRRVKRPCRNPKPDKPTPPTGSESSDVKAIKLEVTRTEDASDNDVNDETPGISDDCSDDVTNDTILPPPSRVARRGAFNKSLSVSEKLAVLAEVESGRKLADVCREYGIASSTVSTFRNHKDAYVIAAQEGRCKAKRLRRSNKDDLNRALLRWYHQTRPLGSAASGSVLQSKAEELAKRLGYKDSTVSYGWIYRFKKRHSINMRDQQPKEAQQDLADADAWLTTSWPQIRTGYSAWDVFSAVEIGVLFRVLPSDAHQFRGSVCERGQLANERLTVFLCTNMAGDEKRPLLAVGCAPLSKPTVASGVRYGFNERSWMTREIFVEELKRWDCELNARKRKVLLLVDRCPCHLVDRKVGLRNIEVIYPPPDAGRRLLPLDHGVVQVFKRRYRKILLMHTMLQEVERPPLLEEALILLNAAWKEVNDPTIRLAFAAYSLRSDNPLDDAPADDSDNVPLEEWSSRFNLREDLVSGICEYDCIDDFLVTSGKVEIEGLFASPTGVGTVKVEASESLEEPSTSLVGILNAVGMLMEFCEKSAAAEDSGVMEALDATEDDLKDVKNGAEDNILEGNVQDCF
ncbi:tigger transposable element-derived protein 4 [Ixodes scapularis]